jgi:two-component system alkaline phosphatase synthesis response regulator PhoP
MPSISPEPTANERPATRILLVDDEPDLLEAVGYILRREGFSVDTATTGPAALAMARATRPALIVLDVMLPELDGLEVCRMLRAESAVPILLLSAKGEEVDRVVGLELGADDYLTKPFAMRELLARVRAMLRRGRLSSGTESPFVSVSPVRFPPGAPEAPATTGGLLVSEDLVIDPVQRRVSLRGQLVALKPKEFDLLSYLARHPDVALSRDTLLRQVWGYDYPVDTRTVDVHIRWLREKIESNPGQPRRIETVRGIGYRFVAPPQNPPPGRE